MIVGRVVRGENLRFFCVCVHVCCSAGVSEVLIKYTGKYVNIYSNMKITFLWQQPDHLSKHKVR